MRRRRLATQSHRPSPAHDGRPGDRADRRGPNVGFRPISDIAPASAALIDPTATARLDARMRTGRRSFTFGLGAVLATGSGAAAIGQNDKDAVAGATVAATLGKPIMSEFQRKRRAEGRLWAEGYTQSELDVAQAKYGLVFPPDLLALLRDRRPVLAYDWRSDDKEIREMLKWPLEGLLFDVENNALWWPEWGDRPGTPEARSKVVTKVVNEAPKLIPLDRKSVV